MLAAALTIAGSDPSGGAGIQADLKTFHQFGVYGEAVVTLITVQNTTAVSRVEVLPGELVADQIRSVVQDIPPDAAKTGALGSADVVNAVAAAVSGFPFPLVVDPVMVSKHGAWLVAGDARQALVDKLIPRAALVMPNLAEAAALTGIEVEDFTGMRKAAQAIREMGAQAVLVKGGHLAGDAVDLLYTGDEWHEFREARIDTPHTHGTGCTYAAAVTASLARKIPLYEAVARAKRYISAAIRSNPGLGRGCGPVNHFTEAQ